MATRFMKSFTTSAAFAAATILSAGAAQAIDYPTRPIVITQSSSNSVTTPVYRLIEQKINERHKTAFKFFFEAKPGAAGNISADYVARAKPDGYTLLSSNCGLSIAPGVSKRLTYDVLTDLVPVAPLGMALQVLTATKDLPANTLPDLVKIAKANPGKYAYGTNGIGSIGNLVGEELRLKTGIELLHVPYAGANEVMRGLLSGDLAMGIVSAAGSLAQVNQGSVKAIAVLAPARSSSLPNTPTANESIPGLLGHVCWNGTLAPAGTPREIIDLLHDYIDEAQQDPEVAKLIYNLGFEPVRISVDDFRALIRKEVNEYRAISKEANIVVD